MAIKKEFMYTKGLKELDKAMEELTTPKFRKAALRKSGKKAMEPVLRSAKKNAPVLKDTERNDVKSGQLRDDIKMSTSVNIDATNKKGKVTKSKEQELKVVVKTGKETEDYALVVEFGREEYKVRRNQAFGKETDSYEAVIGEIKPQPFMQPALEDNKEKVLDTFKDTLGAEIIKQAKKQKKHKGV